MVVVRVFETGCDRTQTDDALISFLTWLKIVLKQGDQLEDKAMTT